MSDEEKDIEIVLDDNKAEEKGDVKVEIEEETLQSAKETHEISPKEGIEELKRKLQAEQMAREEAERRMQHAYRQAQEVREHAQQEINEAHYHQVSSALETVEERAKALKDAFAEASSVGDYQKAAELNSEMIEARDQIERLKAGKQAIKRHLEDAQSRAPVQKIEPPPRVDDMIEDMASKVTPRSAAWLRSAKDHLRDEKSIRKMFNAHEAAVLDGIEPDSDGYFAFIEQRLGMRKIAAPVEEHEESAMSAAAAPAPVRKSAPPPAAPVSRSGPRPGTVRLSAMEAQTAKDLGMTPEEYARNKQALIKEGRYGS